MKKVTALTTAIVVAFLALTGVAPASAAEAKAIVSVPTALPALVDSSPGSWPLYKIVYDGTIYELVTNAGVQTPVALTFEKWRDTYKYKSFDNIATDFVKYPWTPTVYAVTFWPGGEASWQWTEITFAQWQTARFPSVRNAGWIEDSYYYKWGSSGEIFVEDGSAKHVNHKLTYAEWRDSGFRPFVARSNEGFVKLNWSSEIVRITSVSAGSGAAISYAEWEAEAFPSPQLVNRIAGDQFYRNAGESTIWYAGPGMNRPVTYAEWTAAGQPAPILRGAAPIAAITGNAGWLRVGPEVAAATYRSTGGPNCYFARYVGSEDLALQTAEDWVAGFYSETASTIVSIAPTDVWFYSGGDPDFAEPGCADWQPVTEPTGTPLASIPGNGGMYFVGGEVAPGTYTSTGNVSCYWSRLASFSGEDAAIIEAFSVDGNATVVIDATDAGFETIGCGNWEKVS